MDTVNKVAADAQKAAQDAGAAVADTSKQAYDAVMGTNTAKSGPNKAAADAKDGVRILRVSCCAGVRAHQSTPPCAHQRQWRESTKRDPSQHAVWYSEVPKTRRSPVSHHGVIPFAALPVYASCSAAAYCSLSGICVPSPPHMFTSRPDAMQAKETADKMTGNTAGDKMAGNTAADKLTGNTAGDKMTGNTAGDKASKAADDAGNSMQKTADQAGDAANQAAGKAQEALGQK